MTAIPDITTDKLFDNQESWTCFFNEPIGLVTVTELLEAIVYQDLHPVGSNKGGHSSDSSWHTITVNSKTEINKLRAMLLIYNYRVEIKSTGGNRAYLDIFES